LRRRRSSWRAKAKYREPAPPEEKVLPKIPRHWAWASPAQLSAAEPYSLAIGPFGSNLKVSDYKAEGVPLVFVRNIRSGNFNGSKSVFVTAAKAEELEAHQIEGGDILITKMGEPPGDALLVSYRDSHGGNHSRLHQASTVRRSFRKILHLRDQCAGSKESDW
jgi:type I restriction enzyme S subunit